MNITTDLADSARDAGIARPFLSSRSERVDRAPVLLCIQFTDLVDNRGYLIVAEQHSIIVIVSVIPVQDGEISV